MKLIILLQLLLAHVITDFVLQANSWKEAKKRDGYKSGFFWLHIVVAGLTTYVILQQWTNWEIPVFIMVTHAAIELWKITRENKSATGKSMPAGEGRQTGIKYFFIDQSLHLAVVGMAWLWLTDGFTKVPSAIALIFNDQKIITLLIAVVILIWPLGMIIGKVTEPFRAQLDTSDSLQRAGKVIGITERLLIFIFMMANQYTAIGFLIASKSILRISTDYDGRKKSEYVLIGTLISFTFAIVVALMAKVVLKYQY